MSVNGLMERCVKAIGRLAAPAYRPECHYMRGPGPACRKAAGTERRAA